MRLWDGIRHCHYIANAKTIRNGISGVTLKFSDNRQASSPLLKVYSFVWKMHSQTFKMCMGVENTNSASWPRSTTACTSWHACLCNARMHSSQWYTTKYQGNTDTCITYVRTLWSRHLNHALNGLYYIILCRERIAKFERPWINQLLSSLLM